MIPLPISRAGDHDVQVRLVERCGLRTLPVRAVAVRALLARARAVVVRPWLDTVFFALPSMKAVAGHEPIVHEVKTKPRSVGGSGRYRTGATRR